MVIALMVLAILLNFALISVVLGMIPFLVVPSLR